MPVQKDLKRLVRTRMQKTGESYTAARLQVLKKTAPASTTPALDYARLAGMSDASVSAKTGRSWTEWVRRLDAAHLADKPHRQIVDYVSSLGTPDWWTQMVTVGYERIRGLRQRGQRRDGTYEAGKSRTFGVPVEKLFDAFAHARTRNRWLPAKIKVRAAARPRRMRIAWTNGTTIEIGFLPKGRGKSAVALVHQKLPDRSTAEAMKKMWSEHFDRLGELLS